ncbi:hypothetical protein OC846_005669 [Tilletia horrida]|uniref:Uncharacterized protein n=1 Tax=Tilletia horrida TaxID=155126 RepID=A0AAN6JVR7_9BASI|nr:hypothetical protein OC846_005669 [Tilletia horrida]KAK0568705.1 hypothetical protein OC861_001707 [Tilletia horrida]
MDAQTNASGLSASQSGLGLPLDHSSASISSTRANAGDSTTYANRNMMQQDDDDDEEDINQRGPWPVTADNLGRIPEAEQLAPGIRLPNTVEPQHDDDDDDEDYAQDGAQSHGAGGAAGGRGVPGSDHRRKIGPTHVGHFGPDGAPVPGVPPELDPRAAKFRRPTSPGAASVFSLAVQPPGSPKAGAIDGDGLDSSLGGNLGTPNPSHHNSGAGSVDLSHSTASSYRSGIGGALSPSGMSGGGAIGSALGMTSNLRSRQAALASHAPSEVGSVETSSSLDAPLSSRGGGVHSSNSGDEAMMILDDDGAVIADHTTRRHHQLSRHITDSDTVAMQEGDSQQDDDDAEPDGGDAISRRANNIERERMRDRERLGGEAGVGGLTNSRPPTLPSLAALMRQDRVSQLSGVAGGAGGPGSGAGGGAIGGLLASSSRPGSTAATVGTASPPQSTASSSDDGHGGLSRLSRRRNSGMAEGSEPSSPMFDPRVSRARRDDDEGDEEPFQLQGEPQHPAQMQTPPLRPQPAFVSDTASLSAQNGSSIGDYTEMRGVNLGPSIISSSSASSSSGAGLPAVADVTASRNFAVNEFLLNSAAHRSRRSSMESVATIASSSHRPATTSSSGASDFGDGIAGGSGPWGAADATSAGFVGTGIPGRQRRLEETVLLDGPQIGFGKPGTPTGEERMQF